MLIYIVTLQLCILFVYFIVRYFRTKTLLNQSTQRYADLDTKTDKLIATLPGAVCSLHMAPNGHLSIPHATPNIKEILGFTPEELSKDASLMFNYFHADDLNTWQHALDKSSASLVPLHTTIRIHIPSRTEILVETHATPVRDAGGGTLWQCYMQNITHHQVVLIDDLTRLPNRTLLMDRLRQAHADASWHGNHFGLMVLDIDRFKEVNEMLGYEVGDRMLCEAADRLLATVRSYDTVARLSSDEFAILLPEIKDGKDLCTIACKLLDVFRLPFDLSGHELLVTCSIGIAIYPDDSADVEELIKHADFSMYHAKSQGRNNCQFYSKQLTHRTSERIVLGSALRRAVANGELELFYQPQVDILSGKVIGAEALMRWNREDGQVTPDKFIPIAEETGTIVGIGEWLMAVACEAAVEWNNQREEPFKVAINVSTRQFFHNDFLASVRQVLESTQCKPEWIKLEITESLLLKDDLQIISTLKSLHEMGIHISIDDFGTGYSALSYLNRFPVSQIKIDQSFVFDTPNDRDKSELVKAMINIAQSLRLDVIAEGVETQEQAAYLQEHGCFVAQGYLYGKPMPRQQFDVALNQG